MLAGFSDRFAVDVKERVTKDNFKVFGLNRWKGIDVGRVTWGEGKEIIFGQVQFDFHITFIRYSNADVKPVTGYTVLPPLSVGATFQDPQ